MTGSIAEDRFSRPDEAGKAVDWRTATPNHFNQLAPAKHDYHIHIIDLSKNI
ncbi:hypothetical protein [Pannonibacter phragmitetus]|uniref:hypothetical protein n=1 Tax=Pannonibacter phragmitetus TaxID=121719 RepID=UPI0013C4CF39|nr:hypothetical protein [Pannonibacter phragmitetus]